MKIKSQNLALSIRQPFAEQIMRGTKKIEYRNINTNILGRVYFYASKTPHKKAFEKMKRKPGGFLVGVLVGTVEIVGCKKASYGFEWKL
jgi:hypothetical protein